MTMVATRLKQKLKGAMLKWLPGMLTCVQFEDFLIEYMEGDMAQRQRTVFEFHIRICRECRDYMAAYKRTIEVAGRAYDNAASPVPDEVPEDLVKAILAARRG